MANSPADTLMSDAVPDPATQAVLNFLSACPAAVYSLGTTELPWLLERLRDPSLASYVSTRQASIAARSFGSSNLVRSVDFLVKFADCLAIFCDRDDLVSGDLADKELACWVQALQAGGSEPLDTPPTVPTFRWEPTKVPLPESLAAIHLKCGELDFAQRKVRLYLQLRVLCCPLSGYPAGDSRL